MKSNLLLIESLLRSGDKQRKWQFSIAVDALQVAMIMNDTPYLIFFVIISEHKQWL